MGRSVIRGRRALDNLATLALGRPHFFKVALTILALIPILGPIIALWIGNFPDSAPRILRDQVRTRTDFYDRWRSVLNARDPENRFQRWRTLLTKHRNEDP